MAESTPTSLDKKSHRPTKKRALTPTSTQQANLEALFARPDREITIPSSSTTTVTRTTAPPEIVANVQGSSAGAGSGEFHVYKASRRREYERLRAMDEEVRREKADEEYAGKVEELRRKDQEKLDRNRAKREKARARKMKGGKGGEGDGGEKKRLGPARVGGKQEGVNGEAIQGVDGGEGGVEEVGITIHDDD